MELSDLEPDNFVVRDAKRRDMPSVVACDQLWSEDDFVAFMTRNDYRLFVLHSRLKYAMLGYLLVVRLPGYDGEEGSRWEVSRCALRLDSSFLWQTLISKSISLLKKDSQLKSIVCDIPLQDLKQLEIFKRAGFLASGFSDRDSDVVCMVLKDDLSGDLLNE